jgi:hypothetical protein
MLIFALGLFGFTATTVTLATRRNKKDKTFLIVEGDDGEEHIISKDN